MNVMSKIIDALAFANINSADELRAQLDQLERASAAVEAPRQHGPASGLSDGPSAGSAIRHAQGAL